MGKVAGVSAVRVSLNEGLTVLDLKAANTVTLSSLRQVIRNNGFVTKEASVIAKGAVSRAGDQLALTVSESRERLVLRPGANPKPFDDLRARAAGGASIEMVVTGVADVTDPKAIKLTVTGTQTP